MKLFVLVALFSALLLADGLVHNIAMSLITSFAPKDTPIPSPTRSLPNTVNEEIRNEIAYYHQPDLAPSYDFIIVGAGSAGSVVASRLSEIPEWQVLLLEAGPPETPLMDMPYLFGQTWTDQHLWRFSAQPDPTFNDGQPVKVPRGKVLGGTSTINRMNYVRGGRGDYDKWATMGNTGWDYENVLEYFKKSEDMLIPELRKDKRFHGRGGPLTVNYPPSSNLTDALIHAFSVLGIPKGDYNGDSQIRANMLQHTITSDDRARSTNRAFIDPVKERKNISIRILSRVTRILLDEDHLRATGVEFLDKDGQLHRVSASKEVIISAGAIISPQLLMLSGIGPKSHLESLKIKVRKDLPVGQNIQDHPRILPSITFIGPKQEDDEARPIAPSPMIGAFKSFTNDSTQADIGYYTSQRNEKNAATGENYSSVVFTTMLLKSKSGGHISLRDSNPLSDPVIELKLLEDPTDRQKIKESLKSLMDLENDVGLARLNFKLDKTPLPKCGQFEYGVDDYWECVIRRYGGCCNHMSGGCRMGPETDKTSVVDPTLKVHGFENLRVIDASVIPYTTDCNTNAPTIMIGEKGADLIKSAFSGAVPSKTVK